MVKAIFLGATSEPGSFTKVDGGKVTKITRCESRPTGCRFRNLLHQNNCAHRKKVLAQVETVCYIIHMDAAAAALNRPEIVR